MVRAHVSNNERSVRHIKTIGTNEKTETSGTIKGLIREMNATGKEYHLPLPSSLLMPRDLQGRYWAHGNFHSCVITRMSTTNHSRARGTTHFSPVPYPSSDSIIPRMDEDNDQWYHDMGADLHPRDFIFQARIQTACHLSQ